MFERQAAPIVLGQDGLEALCVSLNRPVVDIEHLPVGPARAAIALHRPRTGGTTLAVALRSIEPGLVCVFKFTGELGGSVHQAMDTALSFAEGMGFLFDDDMIAGEGDGGLAAIDDAAGVSRERGAARAHALWCELIGEELPEPSDERVAAGESDSAGENREAAHSGDRRLSKFRGPGVSADGTAGVHTAGQAEHVPMGASPDIEGHSTDSGHAQLGRISIVRRRRRDDPATEADLPTRVLASF